MDKMDLYQLPQQCGTDAGKNLTISAGSSATGSNNVNGGNLILSSGGGDDGTGTSSIQFKTKVSGSDSAQERMRIHTNGYLGINTNTPISELSV